LSREQSEEEEAEVTLSDVWRWLKEFHRKHGLRKVVDYTTDSRLVLAQLVRSHFLGEDIHMGYVQVGVDVVFHEYWAYVHGLSGIRHLEELVRVVEHRKRIPLPPVP